MEKSIERLEPLLVMAMQSLAEGVVLVDAHGSIQYVNRAFAEGFGVPAERIVGMQWDDPRLRVTDPEGRDIAPADRAFRRVLATGEPVLNYDYVVYHVSGRPVRVLLNAVPVWDAGSLVGVAITMTDITERVAAEDVFRETATTLRAFVDQSRYGFFISSTEGEVLLYNKAMEKLNGHSFEEVREKGWLRAAFPDPREAARVAEQARRSLAGEVPYFEEPYTRPDGREVWLSYSVSPVRLHGRDYLSGILIDITDRINAEERARYQSSILDHVRNAVIATDERGIITYVNEPAERLFMWKPGEALGKDVMAWAAPKAGAPQRESLMDVVAREGRWEGEATMRRPDGTEVPLLLSLGALMDDGRSIGYVGVATDLTEIKDAQRKLEEKDRAIRQAYVDVVSAVTGGKLVLMTREELSSALGEVVLPKGGIAFDTLSETRHRVLEAMEEAAIKSDPNEAIVAYGEAATNALKHAGGGRYGVFRRERGLQVLITDDGPGIDFRELPKATLTAGFSTKHTLGLGFTIMLDLSDRLLLASAPGCTEVVLEFSLR